MAKQLFVDKYRPSTKDDYVFLSDVMEQQFDEWVKAGVLPHLLLGGRSGTGKTSLFWLLMKTVMMLLITKCCNMQWKSC